MENRINIAELLKDCPKGMELDCVMYENVSFEGLAEDTLIEFPILVNICDDDGEPMRLTKEGFWSPNPHAKCVIFPKGKTTWEGFQRPFKDGDIVATENGIFIGIVKVKNNMQVGAYCAINEIGTLSINVSYVFERLATEEERQKLFKAIKDNGYKWNAENKTLEKLVNPNFKVGNKIIRKGRKGIDYPIEVLAIENGRYKLPAMSMPIDSQDEWELVSDKFDITTLKPFDKVLVRNDDSFVWKCNLYSHYSEYPHHYICMDTGYKQCIPYNSNEHLVGTTNDCSDFYKIWEK